LFVQVKALFDFVTEVAGELCFNADDVLLITNQVFLNSVLLASMLHSIFTNVTNRLISSVLMHYLMQCSNTNTNNKISIVPKSGAKTCNQRH